MVTSLCQLTEELLVAIVDQLGDDHESLDNLSAAASRNIKLLEATLSKRWSKITIDDRDLEPLPEEREFDDAEELLVEAGLGNYWKPAGQGIQDLLKKYITNRQPVNYVRELIFDMRMFRFRDPAVLYSDADLDMTELMPTTLSFKYSWDLLAPGLSKLRTLRCDGDVPNDLLETVGESEVAKKIHTIILRRLCGPGRFQDTDSKNLVRTSVMQGRPQPCLRFERLAALTNLRFLKLHRLLPFEVFSFLTLLPKLTALEGLTLSDEILAEPAPRKCAVHDFMEHFLKLVKDLPESAESTQQRAAVLPESLKSLTVIDLHKGDMDVKTRKIPATKDPLFTQFTQNSLTSCGSIRALSLETDDTTLVSQFAAGFDGAALESLMYSGCKGEDTRANQFNELCTLISSHKETLSRIKLLSAWEFDHQFSGNFNVKWQGQFSIQELVLGTLPVHVLSVQHEDRLRLKCWMESFTSDTSDHDLTTAIWGNELKRIRIDSLFPIGIDTSVLNEPRFHKLKIIMLQPFDAGIVPNSKPTKDASGYVHITITQAREGAQQILQDALDSLRVVVLQDHWFWISDKTENDTGHRLWDWTEAERSPQQAKLMREILSDDDWKFLTSNEPPHWNARHRPSQNKDDTQVYPEYQAVPMQRGWNYVSALRTAS